MAIHIKTEPTPRSVIEMRQSIVRRLMSFGAERRRLEQRLTLLAEMEKEFQDLLRELDQHNEQQRLIDIESPPTGAAREDTEGQFNNNMMIKNLLRRALRDGPRSLADLVNIAHHSGVNFGEKAPARVIHFNLLNLKNAGVVENDDQGWKLANKEEEETAQRS